MTCLLSLAGLLNLLAALSLAATPDDPPAEPKPAPRPAHFEIRFTDRGLLQVSVRDPALELATKYGKLVIPFADIQTIEFATRLSDDHQKRVREAIAHLGSPQFKLREAGSAELLRLLDKSYPALLDAEHHKDGEVARRASELLERIRILVPAEDLALRPHDVVVTDQCRLVGTISGPTLRVSSAQFGDVPLKLSDLRSLRAPGAALAETAMHKAEPDPGNLITFQNQIGKTLYFRVTGSTAGTIWGTDTYTTDSLLAVAAVHAGLVEPGKSAVIAVTILPAQNAFLGSTRHGVTSNVYGPYPGAYSLSK